jgi:hypothetical protein
MAIKLLIHALAERQHEAIKVRLPAFSELRLWGVAAVFTRDVGLAEKADVRGSSGG